MNNTLKSIYSRRSIRKYKKQAIPSNIVEEIIKAAMYAPSAHNKQPWHFITIDNRSLLDQIPTFHPHAQMCKNSNLAILVCGDTRQENTIGYLALDCAAATQNLLLAAYTQEIGSVWTGIYPREERMTSFQKLLNLPQEIIPISLIVLGYPDETPPSPQRFFKEKIHDNKW